MSLDLRDSCPLLQVFDMPRALAFYRNVLGFEVVMSSEPGDEFDWGLLRLGEAELMLNTMYEKHDRPPSPHPARVAAHGDTTLFFGCRDLDAAYEHLKEHEINVNPPVVRDYGMRQLSVSDPDGYGLCFQWPVSQERS